MPRQCKTCARPDVKAIDELIGRKASLRKIMDCFGGLSQGGLQRHRDNCTKEVFAAVMKEKRQGLLAAVDEVKIEIAALKAEFPKNPNVRIGLIGKMLDVIEKEAKLTGAYKRAEKAEITPIQIAQKVATELIDQGFSAKKAKDFVEARYGVTLGTVVQ